jgi:hypothetical protein
MRSALLGFSDFFDELGAAKKPTPKPAAPAGKAGAGPKNVTPYPKPALTSGVKGHKKALKTGHSAILKAGKALGRAQLLLAHKPAAKTAVTAKITGKNVVLGAAANLSPKAMRAVQIHNAAVVKARKAAQVLAQHALKTKKSVQHLAKKMVEQKKTMKQLRSPKRPGTHVGDLLADPMVGEQVAEMLGEYYEAVGAVPDPANPGYLDDGSPDPAAGAAPADASLDLSLDTGAGDAVDGGAELGPPAPMDYIFRQPMATYGGIPYDESKGRPPGFAASYGLISRLTDDYHTPNTSGIDGTAHYGYAWGSFDQEGIPHGIPWGGQGKDNVWNHFHGREQGAGSSGWHHTTEDLSEVIASPDKLSTNNAKYGAITGNPGMKDFSGMRMDSEGKFFWLPQEAPDWLLFPIKQAAALTAQAAAKAAADAAKADAAAQAKLAADNAAAQAAQEAANALSESAAASTAKVAKGEEETKQAAAETEAQQAIVKQAQAETTAKDVETEQVKQTGDLMIQQARQQVEQDKQVADMLVAQAQQEQAYLAAHPELDPSAAMAASDEEGGGEEGGEDQITDEDAAEYNEGNEDIDIDYTA